MVSINVEPEVKKRFSEDKLEYCGKIRKGLNENEFVKILLDKFEEKKR